MKRLRRLALFLLVPLCAGCITIKPRSHRPSPSAIVIQNIPVRPWGDNTCGAGALSTVLNYFRDPATEDDLNAKLKKGRHGGIVSIDLLLEARNRDFDARLVKGTPRLVEEAVRSGSPPILMLRVLDAPGTANDLFHYIVVDGYDPQRRFARMQFGDGQLRWASLETASAAPIGGGVEKAWAGTDYATLIVQPRDPRREEQTELRNAVLLEDSGRLGEARDAYRAYVAAHPDSSVGWTNLGNVEAQLGNLEEAESAYGKALQADATNRDATNNLAWLLMQRKRLEEAEEMARRAVALPGPDSFLVLDTLGQVLLARGRCDEALDVYSRGVTETAEARQRATALYGLGLSQARCGHSAEARATFEKALRSSPDAPTEKAIRAEMAKLP